MHGQEDWGERFVSDNKKAELSQRRPRDAPRVPLKISRVLTGPRILLPKFVMGVCSERY